MIRSSFVKGMGLGILVLGSLACGDKPPPKPPEVTPPAIEDAGEAPKPASTESHADAGAGAATAEVPPPPAAAKLELPATAAKLKFKSKKDFDVELKSDGTVHSAGKAAAKIIGMELQDPAGKTQLKVDSDGAVITGDGAAYAKFEGDELTSLIGAKYAIAEDGALASTDEKGKKTVMGKTEGVGSAKRAALLSAAFVMWGTKAPAPAAAKPADKKPADKKPADKKPADKKPADKPKK